MTQFKFIHAADIHLDSPLKGLESYPDAPVNQIRNATRRALDNLIDLAIDQEVAFVLLAGDIADGDWKDYNTGLFFTQRMGRLREAGIRVFMVSGNHDAASVIAKALRPPDNVHIFSTNQPESIHIPDLSVVIHGQSYKNRETTDDLAARYPQAIPDLFNIGLLHTSLTGRPGHEPYAPTRLDILYSKGFDYWALGHVHQREVVSDNPWIVFSGNIQGRHIKESGAKGCTLVQTQDGEVTVVEKIDLDVLRWEQKVIDISMCTSMDDLWEQIRKSLELATDQSQGRALAIRLILEGQTSLHSCLHRQFRHISEECRAMAVGLGDIWLEKLKLETKPQKDPEEAFDENTALTYLIRSIKGWTLSNDYIQQIPELADLKNKLPPELINDIDVFDQNNQDNLKKIQEDVQELLLGRLLR